MTEEAITYRSLAKMIDHSLLHPTMTDEIVRKGCELALKYGVACVSVMPWGVPLTRDVLAGSGVAVGSVIGFPHGTSTSRIKFTETLHVIADGATEVDMVINVGKALGGDWDYVSEEIKSINHACTTQGAILKVIFETDFLQDEHIIRLCEICSEHEVAFVKTSTGYGFVKQPNGDYNYKGATDHVLELMRTHAAPEVQLKAAGAVRTLDGLLRVRARGATRCGATATAVILDEARARGYV
jgi:deoxyribose-phosphate aldolase